MRPLGMKLPSGDLQDSSHRPDSGKQSTQLEAQPGDRGRRTAYAALSCVHATAYVGAGRMKALHGTRFRLTKERNAGTA